MTTCCPACGHPLPTWTREGILAALERWAAEHDGELPGYRDWHPTAHGYPNSHTVCRRFGSWEGAITLAERAFPGVYHKRRRLHGEIVQPKPSPRELFSAAELAAIVQRRRNGTSTYALARQLDVADRHLRGILRGERKGVTLDVADRILCGLGCPEELHTLGRIR